MVVRYVRRELRRIVNCLLAVGQQQLESVLAMCCGGKRKSEEGLEVATTVDDDASPDVKVQRLL